MDSTFNLINTASAVQQMHGFQVSVRIKDKEMYFTLPSVKKYGDGTTDFQLWLDSQEKEEWSDDLMEIDEESTKANFSCFIKYIKAFDIPVHEAERAIFLKGPSLGIPLDYFYRQGKSIYGKKNFKIKGLKELQMEYTAKQAHFQLKRRHDSTSSTSSQISLISAVSLPVNGNMSSQHIENPIQHRSNSALDIIKDSEGFTLPKKYFKPSSPTKANPAVTTENSYEILSEQVASAGDSADPDKHVPAEPQIRPLMILNGENIRDLISKIGNAGFQFSVRHAGRFTRLLPVSLDDKCKIIDFLKAESADFYNVPNAGAPLKAVIQGLSDNHDTEEIKESLTERGYEVLAVHQLKTFKEKRPLPYYQVQLKRTPKAKEIFKEKYIGYYSITVVPFKSKNRIPQCSNCQLFFHIAANCNIKPRCNKCKESHHYKECPILKTPTSTVTCCNCGGPHPSNFKDCPSRPKEKKKDAESNRRPHQRNVSYARATAPTPQIQENNATENIHLGALTSIIEEIKKELNVKSFYHLHRMLQSALHKIRNQKTQEEKLLCFLDSLTTVASN